MLEVEQPETRVQRDDAMPTGMPAAHAPNIHSKPCQGLCIFSPSTRMTGSTVSLEPLDSPSPSNPSAHRLPHLHLHKKPRSENRNSRAPQKRWKKTTSRAAATTMTTSRLRTHRTGRCCSPTGRTETTCQCCSPTARSRHRYSATISGRCKTPARGHVQPHPGVQPDRILPAVEHLPSKLGYQLQLYYYDGSIYPSQDLRVASSASAIRPRPL